MALTPKQAARRIIDALPEDATLGDIAYAMYVRAKIERGLRDAEAGPLLDHAEVMREIDEWLWSAGRE